MSAIHTAAVVAGGFCLSMSLHGCGGETGGDTPDIDPNILPASTATSTITPDSSGLFCCWWPQSPAPDICGNCKRQDARESHAFCIAPGTWCGPDGEITTTQSTTAPYPTGGPNASTPEPQNGSTSDTTTWHWEPTDPTVPTTTTTTAMVITTKAFADDVEYIRSVDHPNGHFCGGDYQIDRKKIVEHEATSSLGRCAQVVDGDKECSRTFYSGIDSTGARICRCVLKTRTCIDAPKNPDDTFFLEVFDIVPKLVPYINAPGTAVGQFCGNAAVRKRITLLDATIDASHCSQAVFDDFECSRKFYFSENRVDKSLNHCTCVLAGSTCKVTSSIPDDYHNVIYNLVNVRPPSVYYEKAKEFKAGDWCSGGDGSRKVIDTDGAQVSPAHCAQAVAADPTCGPLFYYGSGGGDPLCRCVPAGKNCKVMGNIDDGYLNQIYRLGRTTSTAVLRAKYFETPLVLSRDRSFRTVDGKLHGYWNVPDFRSLVLDYDRTLNKNKDIVWAKGHGKSFGGNSKQIVTDSLPSWLGFYFWEPAQFQNILELQV